jgi:hypothetical protein
MPSKTLLLYRLQILTKYKTLGKTEIQEELNSFLPCYHTQHTGTPILFATYGGRMSKEDLRHSNYRKLGIPPSLWTHF